MPNSQQALIWTDADLFHWCLYALMRDNELMIPLSTSCSLSSVVSHIFLKDMNRLRVFLQTVEGNSTNSLLQFWYWIFWYQVVHMVRVNHLHFEDYGHVHQHFSENSFGIYQGYCHIDIHTWKDQRCSHWCHKLSEFYLQNFRALYGLEMESRL